MVNIPPGFSTLYTSEITFSLTSRLICSKKSEENAMSKKLSGKI